MKLGSLLKGVMKLQSPYTWYISLQDIFNADNKRGSYYLAFGKFSCFIYLHNLSQEYFKEHNFIPALTCFSELHTLRFYLLLHTVQDRGNQ
jgi:hypothetical protein